MQEIRFCEFLYSSRRRWKGGSTERTEPEQSVSHSEICCMNSLQSTVIIGIKNDFQVESFYGLSADFLSTGNAGTSHFHHLGYVIYR